MSYTAQFKSFATRRWATVCLCLINVVFLLGGLGILLGSISIHNTGWVGVLKTYWTGMNTLLTSLYIIGGVVMAISLLGSIAGCLRWRLGLLIYAIIVSILLIVFVVVAILSFRIQHDANGWNNKAYPAASGEVQVKTRFDSSWCYAQGEYICNSMTIDDAFQLFAPNVTKPKLLDLFNNVNAVCDGIGPMVTLVPELKTVCDGCGMAKQFQNFSSVLEWANGQCPRTKSTLLWCGSYIITKNTNQTQGTAPYTHCRHEFLNFVSKGTAIIGWESVSIVIWSLVVICCAVFLRHWHKTENSQTEWKTESSQVEWKEMMVLPSTDNQTSTPQSDKAVFGEM